jgi:single-stranded DNA-specific DHH superfamily exonuclease
VRSEILSKSMDEVMAMLEQKQEKLNVTISVLKDQMEGSMVGIVAGYKKQTMMLGCVMEALLVSSKTQNKILKSVEELHDRFDGCSFHDIP